MLIQNGSIETKWRETIHLANLQDCTVIANSGCEIDNCNLKNIQLLGKSIVITKTKIISELKSLLEYLTIENNDEYLDGIKNVTISGTGQNSLNLVNCFVENVKIKKIKVDIRGCTLKDIDLSECFEVKIRNCIMCGVILPVNNKVISPLKIDDFSVGSDLPLFVDWQNQEIYEKFFGFNLKSAGKVKIACTLYALRKKEYDMYKPRTIAQVAWLKEYIRKIPGFIVAGADFIAEHIESYGQQPNFGSPIMWERNYNNSKRIYFIPEDIGIKVCGKAILPCNDTWFPKLTINVWE